LDVAEGTREWTDQGRMAFLLNAAREFGSTLDQEKIYTTLRSLISDVMPVDGLIVSSFDPATSLIRCEYVWSDGVVLDVSGFPPIAWNETGKGMQSQVILTGRAEVFNVAQKVREPDTNYVEASPKGKPKPVEKEPAAKTAMMAPMVLEGVVTGVVQVMSDRPSAFSPEDLDVFESLALMMSPAWNNARTYDRASRDRRLNDRILDTSPDIIYLFDLRTSKIDFVNQQLEKQLGYGSEDVLSMGETTLLEVMHPEDAARLPALIARYEKASDDDLLQSEWRIASKLVGWRWFLNRSRVFERDVDGRPVKILGFATDITERRESEKQLRETEDRYRLLAETGPYLVWSAKPDGALEYVNQRWHEYFGASVTLTDDRSGLIHEQDREQSIREYKEAIRSGEAFECEYRLLRHDGVYRWFLCRGAPIRDEHGVIRLWLGMLVDIHDQKETEAALEARVQQRTVDLEDAVKELEGFTYTVSHDLRGPLRAISAASMILREDFGELLPTEAQRHLLRQADAAKKMGTLIDDLLKLSRLGRQEMAPAEFDLGGMALDVARELGAVDRMRIEPDLVAFGDDRLVRFVLLNLIENALKFSPEGGQIRVGKKGEAFFVADEGIGFEPQYAEKVFKPFERLVRDEEYPGTGIGLANAHRIVKRHSGRIWAESEAGKGACFYFTLPHSPIHQTYE
jgi:PAS domain S-box-containing protein